MTEEKKTNVYVPPVIEHSEWDEVEERTLLFTITKPAPTEGDPGAVEAVEYSMPAKPHVGLAINFLRMARKLGAEMANVWLLEEAAGEDAVDALTAEPDLEYDEIGRIMARARAIVLGGLEVPKD